MRVKKALEVLKYNDWQIDKSCGFEKYCEVCEALGVALKVLEETEDREVAI